MRPNPQFPADLVTFPEEILNGKLIFCAVIFTSWVQYSNETHNLLSKELPQNKATTVTNLRINYIPYFGPCLAAASLVWSL